ncbi:nucleoside recognition domain protein [Desulfonatronospira thiodismutans ASO3-1]|uniref:Nucleoside recognition domain protein n=1 Tax=Desulfonatronospira thiodismutans ASO3-1 TaxID=555779 RepID=D6SNI0_9BACT|nr:membrane protein [Desulfonatronospira thiodismutans]EFI34306.1 nucleoside recognition domain protein [Desulfonatronospira thiodismutans ASO3-1]
MFTLYELWSGLGFPLLKICVFIALGVFVGNLIESMNWTRFMARLAAPLTRMARLRDVSGASFSMAFFSGITANTMLAEAYSQEKLTYRELVLSNLFNSLPTYFLHLPTTFFIMVPLIKAAALPYLLLTIIAALLRTLVVVVLGRFILSPKPEPCVECQLPGEGKLNWTEVLARVWKRFKFRFKKIIIFTVPIYTLFFILQQAGFFDWVEESMAEYVHFMAWLSPQALSIVVLQLAAELSAGLAAAGAMLDSGALGVREVVLALLTGNILSSPMRAIRHQLPYYAGIFNPKLAVKLIFYNQSLRVGSLILVGALYYLVT